MRNTRKKKERVEDDGKSGDDNDNDAEIDEKRRVKRIGYE